MTLEEAIVHLDESLNDQSHDWGCAECKLEHVQLREWLIELKERRTAAVCQVDTICDAVDEALRILDSIHGRMNYGDYRDLHDAISDILP